MTVSQDEADMSKAVQFWDMFSLTTDAQKRRRYRGDLMHGGFIPIARPIHSIRDAEHPIGH
jgi:hypothetical protein